MASSLDRLTSTLCKTIGVRYDKYNSDMELLFLLSTLHCYMDTNSFVYEIGTECFHKEVEKDVEAMFDTSGYSRDDNKSLQIGKNMKVIITMKDELGGNIMTQFVALRCMVSVKIHVYRKARKKVTR